MKRRFTTILVIEQDTNDPNYEIDDPDQLHDHIFNTMQPDGYGMEVVAVQTIVEKWDPETKVYVVE